MYFFVPEPLSQGHANSVSTDLSRTFFDPVVALHSTKLSYLEFFALSHDQEAMWVLAPPHSSIEPTNFN